MNKKYKLILVLTIGRVGSNFVSKTIKKYFNDNNIKIKVTATHGEKNGKKYIYNYLKKLNSFMKKKNYQNLILIINRNFFERDVSNYFFKINRHLEYNNKILFNHDNCTLEDIIIKYNENSIQNKESIFLYYHWYDYVFSKCFNLKLYNYEFKNNKIFIK